MSVTTAARPASPSIGGSALTGTGTLIRFMLRRDRIRIPVWVGGITLFTLSTALGLPDLYPSAAERAAAASTMELPATVAMFGPNYAGPQNYHFGPMFAHQMMVMTGVIVALMSVLLLVRHTRTEEQSGRAELVRATVVGRHAQTTAAIVVIGMANAGLGLLIAAGLGASGIETMTWGGSLLFGASLGMVGLVFAGVAAVTVQVTEHARGAAGLAIAGLGAAYALRAIGDIGTGTLTWLSPLGWAQQTRAYVDDRWWPLLPGLALSAVLVLAAVALSTRRDVGAGLRPPRPGAARASEALANPQGHAVRLQRAGLIGWAVGLLVLGVMYGSVLGGAEDMLGAVEDLLPDITGAGLTDSFASMVVSVLAIICSIPAILAVLRLRSEETSGRAEPVLATGISRSRWALTHVVVALAGGAGVLLLAGLGLGAAGAGSTGEASLLWRAAGAALAYVPAVWVCVGIAFFLFGLLPRAVIAAWFVVAYSFVVVYLGGILQFPEWLSRLSPFGHVPQLPAADLELLPLVALTVVAAGLIVGGLAAFRRRDLQSPA